MPNLISPKRVCPKITLVSFYTEGKPFDNGLDLRQQAMAFKSKAQEIYDNVILLTPSILALHDLAWEEILYSQSLLNQHSTSSIDFNFNPGWAALNCLLWKPAIMASLLQTESCIEENSILIYHDINLIKYPCYGNNIKSLGPYFEKKLRYKSIALVADTVFPLDHDCKQELLRKYLGSSGRTLCHRWAGCMAFKKDNASRKFCKLWFKLSSIPEARSQITSHQTHPGFYSTLR